jgi:hypothetical protein
MKIKKEAENIYSVVYDTQYELTMSFVRLQEFYESPDLRGKYFTLEEYMDYWAENFGNGSFDYPVRWSGFNIPGKVLSNWIDTFGAQELNGFREREKGLINRLNRLLKRDKKSLNDVYVIGAYKGANCKSVIHHEMAHALYNLNLEYRRNMNKLIESSNIDHIIDAKERLIQMGYCEDVILDEIQAYWSTSDKHYLYPLDVRSDFREYYKKYIK